MYTAPLLCIAYSEVAFSRWRSETLRRRAEACFREKRLGPSFRSWSRAPEMRKERDRNLMRATRLLRDRERILTFRTWKRKTAARKRSRSIIGGLLGRYRLHLLGAAMEGWARESARLAEIERVEREALERSLRLCDCVKRLSPARQSRPSSRPPYACLPPEHLQRRLLQAFRVGDEHFERDGSLKVGLEARTEKKTRTVPTRGGMRSMRKRMREKARDRLAQTWWL